ncbi:hypothetical protein [Buttiauxella agrestis]|uniref:hypothetical protein n=1 Tax=Buttiauxella agrestis TaxID=82977 RepID=UPI00397689B9
MGNVEHQIPLNGITPTDLDGIKDLIESNSEIFNNYLLAGFGGNASFSVVDRSLEVTNIEPGYFEYTVLIDFYAGCKGMNDVDPRVESAEFDIKDGKIIIILDETVWNVE